MGFFRILSGLGRRGLGRVLGNGGVGVGFLFVRFLGLEWRVF